MGDDVDLEHHVILIVFHMDVKHLTITLVYAGLSVLAIYLMKMKLVHLYTKDGVIILIPIFWLIWIKISFLEKLLESRRDQLTATQLNKTTKTTLTELELMEHSWESLFPNLRNAESTVTVSTLLVHVALAVEIKKRLNLLIKAIYSNFDKADQCVKLFYFCCQQQSIKILLFFCFFNSVHF